MELNGKILVTAQELLDDSYSLATMVHESGFSPNYIVGIWRGGCFPGTVVQEILEHLGCKSDHIAVRTSSRNGDTTQRDDIDVHGLHYLIERFSPDDRLLIVDDVFDTGRSIDALISDVRAQARRNTPGHIKIATLFYKPDNNKTKSTPDFYVHKTPGDKWIFFPHEFIGLTKEEVAAVKGQTIGLHYAEKKV